MKMILVEFHHVELPPPPKSTYTYIQTDDDCTKRVVTTLRDHTLKKEQLKTLKKGNLFSC